MLVWNSSGLKEALTKVSPAMETRAVRAFRNVLGWMCDRPVKEERRMACADAVLELAMQDQQLTDEVYMQIMKQLTRNPSKKSKIEGWKLMHRVSYSAPPSRDLHKFIRLFIFRAQSQQDQLPEILKIAKLAYEYLNPTGAEEDMSEKMVDLSELLVRSPTTGIEEDASGKIVKHPTAFIRIPTTGVEEDESEKTRRLSKLLVRSPTTNVDEDEFGKMVRLPALLVRSPSGKDQANSKDLIMAPEDQILCDSSCKSSNFSAFGHSDDTEDARGRWGGFWQLRPG